MILHCLDDATIDDYLHARLSEGARAAADAHVDACADCSAIVSVLAGGGLASPSSAVDAQEAELPEGTLVGRHVIVERLGEGAMGIVYLANDPELDRKVALKLLRPGSAQGAGERMQREAQAMAKVTHPNVVTVHDVGRFRGAVYLAMEFVDGRTLRAWCADERGVDERVAMLVAAGRGLAAAHAAGLVHRDFKPENVLVGSDLRVRVTDFGLASLGDPVAGAETKDGDVVGMEHAAPLVTLTRTGALLGTPAYMAPELWRAEEATPASDQFAFGVTLYEVLLGERPFKGATAAELRAAIERGPSIPDDVPGKSGPARRRLRRVLARALSARPGDRYATLDALLAELAPAPVRSRRSPAWLALPFALALLGAGGTALFSRGSVHTDPCGAGTQLSAAVMDPDREARIHTAFTANGATWAAVVADRAVAALDVYRTQWAAAHRATCEATEVRHEQSAALLDARMHCLHRGLDQATALSARFENPDAETVLHAPEAVSSLPPLAACSDTATLGAMESRPPGEKGVALTQLEARLATAHVAAVAGVSSAAAVGDARGIADAATDIGYRPAIAEARLLLATLLRRSGDFMLASKEADAALVAAEASHDDREAALVWLELLAVRGEAGHFADAIAAEAPATAAIARIGSPPDLEASLHFELGVARTNLTRAEYENAARDLNASFLARERLFGEKNLDVARTLTALGNLGRVQGDLEGALAIHQHALAIDTELLGAEHPGLARDHHNIGGILRMQGKLDEAQAAYERALVLSVRGPGPRSLAAGRTENSLGLVAMAKDDLPSARAHFERAKDILAGHPDQTLATSNLELLGAAEQKRAPRPSTSARPRPAAYAAPRPSGSAAPAQGSYGPAQTFDTERR